MLPEPGGNGSANEPRSRQFEYGIPHYHGEFWNGLENDPGSALTELQKQIAKLKAENQELRHKNQDLSRSQADLLALYHQSPVGHFTLDRFGFILDVNQTGAEMLGVERSILRKLPFGSFILDQDLLLFHEHRRMLLIGNPRSGCEITLVPRRGARFPALVESIALANGGVDSGHVHLSVSDISDRNELREQLRHQEKLAVIGQLAGGIAHDFNNILLAIMATAEVMQLQPDDRTSYGQRISRIIEQSVRASSLVRQLLDFGRQSHVEPQVIDLVAFLQEMVRLMQRTLEGDVSVSLNATLPEALVAIDPGQFQQVILNLAINAQHAMGQGGKLSIHLRHAVSREPIRTLTGLLPAGSWYRVDVADTGTGIAPDILPRVLEPFFTTKPVGKGSGLGLPQVYGIMRQHGGDLLIKSRLNVGTTISLFLPDKQALAAELPEHVQHQLFVTGHGEHILVIDDDRHVLAATADMLRHLGYYPILFTDGREALDSLKQGTVKADLLLADARMPHLSGEQLLPELEAINFASPIVIMTGFVPEIQTVVRENSCVVACVQKPFNVELLANTIASALAR